ncbi:MAG: phosphoketolase family protein [Pseudomonadota bacterium]
MTPDELNSLDAYWRAANFLAVGQIYLLDNPLLKEPLRVEHVKPRLLGHWGTSPGLNFIYAHLNRVIRHHDLNAIFVCGPGHGGPAMVANTYLEGTYSEIYPDVPMNESGLKRLFRQFSFPGGIPSHASPDLPGSIHEGGELGYALSHAYGAAFDNPDLVVACVVGDGEAETGPLAAAWHSNKFLNPRSDGAVLPILHLNGFKIANPTILARISQEELRQLLRGYGYEPLFVEGADPMQMHRDMADALDTAISAILRLRTEARKTGLVARPTWPMIVLRSPKGWTGPRSVDGLKTEGSWRSHQVPLTGFEKSPEHLKALERWLRSYRPDELFDERGCPRPVVLNAAPSGARRMGANPHANGGLLRRPLELPDAHAFSVACPSPGSAVAEATRVFGQWLAAVAGADGNKSVFRLVGPDETSSNRLDAVIELAERSWMAELQDDDTYLSRNGRVLEILSEHTCQGWLEGYLLTGRHGLFSCYEAFIHIVDSMFNQHAKWLDASRKLPWRKPVSSLNILLTSHVWRQDHNGFSHQDPGFIDVALNKKADVVRVYLPPDANTLLVVGFHILNTWNRINIVVAGKQPAPQWLTFEEAGRHCSKGAGRWAFASNEGADAPDIVFASAGDVPTLEVMAAIGILNEHLPDVKIRMVNVIDLMTLQPESVHPHGLSEQNFDKLFTRDRPILFAYHGYPPTIHRLCYKRANHGNLHVRGYVEEGTTTTPFDMTVLNRLDRFHLVCDALKYLQRSDPAAQSLLCVMQSKLEDHAYYIREHGQDMPEVRDWRWRRN